MIHSMSASLLPCSPSRESPTLAWILICVQSRAIAVAFFFSLQREQTGRQPKNKKTNSV